MPWLNCSKITSKNYPFFRSVSRGPAYGTSGGPQAGHRRTPSNSSTSASYQFPRRGSQDDEYWINPPPVPPQIVGSASEYDTTGMRVRRLSRQSSYTGVVPGAAMEVERPQTLELPLTPRTPMRSSLRNANYSNISGAGPSRSAQGGSSSNGTPTNPTPPDSLSEDVFLGGTSSSRSDSGFVSNTNRVRFSPSPFDKGNNVVMTTDWSPTHETQGGPPLHRGSSGRQASGVRAGPMLHHHYVTESDLQRDFNLYSS